MRFTTAWAKVAAQNVTLKVSTVLLAIVTITQLTVIATLASKDPIVIERGCFSRSTQAKPAEPTKDEIKAFLIEALAMRFDSSGYVKGGFLSLEETSAREKEQSVLKERQMVQRIIVNDVKVGDNQDVTVMADRLISIQKIKSALSLNMKVILQRTLRTESNPYGLILNTVNQIEEKEENK